MSDKEQQGGPVAARDAQDNPEAARLQARHDGYPIYTTAYVEIERRTEAMQQMRDPAKLLDGEPNGVRWAREDMKAFPHVLEGEKTIALDAIARSMEANRGYAATLEKEAPELVKEVHRNKLSRAGSVNVGEAVTQAMESRASQGRSAAPEEARVAAPKNSISFDRELSEQRAQVRKDNEFARERVAQLRSAKVGPAPADDPRPREPKADDRAEAAANEQDIEARKRALELVMRRYVKAGDTYHRRDEANTPAFTDKGERLHTEHNDPEIARSMVDLAQAKGWDCLKVSGSKEFKAEVWLYAMAKGIDVAGFRPTELDRAKLAELRDDVMRVVSTATAPKPAANDDRAQAREERAAGETRPNVGGVEAPAPAPIAQQPSLQRRPESDVAPALTPRHEAALAAMEAVLRRPSELYPQGHSEAQIRAAQAFARGQWTNDRVYVGKITEHGHAKYEFKPEGSPSYYVKMEDPNGGRYLLWGVDLERALGAGKPLPNEDVVIHYKGAQKVDVPVVVPTGNGERHIRFESVDRNTWDIAPVRTLAPDRQQEALRRAENSRGPNIRLGNLQARPQQAARPPAQQPAQMKLVPTAPTRGR